MKPSDRDPAAPSSGVAIVDEPEQQRGSISDHTEPIGISTRNGIDAVRVAKQATDSRTL